MERAVQLDEVGAGLQISPNASRVLVNLGLGARLAESAVTPGAVSAMSAHTGRELARIPLQGSPEAPYWVIHRADLQSALVAAAAAHPDIELRLGTTVTGFSDAGDNVTATCRSGPTAYEERGRALIGADGVWSEIRNGLFPEITAQFSGRIAWRGTIPADRMTDRDLRIQLWMGRKAHLVVYPVSGGQRFNVVAIAADGWSTPGWDNAADAADLHRRFSAAGWTAPARTIIEAVPEWRRWALFTLPGLESWSRGRVALLGDAAHAMLPFAAQGAAMAIEDAAMLAVCMDEKPHNVIGALAQYGRLRRERVRRVQRLACQNGQIYHLTGPMALARDLTMKMIGGQRLHQRQKWVYDWKPK